LNALVAEGVARLGRNETTVVPLPASLNLGLTPSMPVDDRSATSSTQAGTLLGSSKQPGFISPQDNRCGLKSCD